MPWAEMAREVLLPFATALGVVVGGSLGGGLITLVTSGSPLATLQELAQNLKLWAVIVAIGGTFPALRAIETGLFDGQILTLLRQLLVLVSAFAGASAGHFLSIQLTGTD